MKPKRLSAIFLVGVMLMALSGRTAVWAEAKDFPPPQSCLEQVENEGRVLHIYDWAEWWPEALYSGFSKEYGVKIVRDNYANEDEMVTKFKLNPKVNYDVVLAGTRTFQQLRGFDMPRKLNHAWIPNVNEYLTDACKNLPGNEGYNYGVPTDIFLVGVAFNTKYVDPGNKDVTSWNLVFDGKSFKGRITMLDDLFLTIGSALKALGYSANTTDEDQLMQAKDLLLQQKKNVMAYDAYPKRLVLEEEAWISHCWAGEAWLYYQELDTIRGGLPEEGTILGNDVLWIPKGSQHPATAHLFMNYIHRPENMLKLAVGTGYPPPNTAAAKMLPEKMKNWPGMEPDPEYLRRCEYLTAEAFTGKGLEIRTKIWKEIKK